MDAASQVADTSLVHEQPLWTKTTPVLGLLAMIAYIIWSDLRVPPRPGPDTGFVVILAFLGVATLAAILNLRTRTVFSATGVTHVGLLRSTSLDWRDVDQCTIARTTQRRPRGRSIDGVALRFVGGRSPQAPGADERAIEVFLADQEPPLAPDIVAFLKTIPRLSGAAWTLLERPAR